jgi:hypothetical protein
MAEQSETPKTVTVLSSAGIPHGTEIHTPAGMPNIVIKTKSPLNRTVIRISRVYVTSLVGMLTVVMGDLAPGALTPPQDFVDKLMLAGGLALAPAAITLLTNAAEFLAKLDSQA